MWSFFLWVVRFDFWEKPLWHSLQMKGLSPECTLKWFRNRCHLFMTMWQRGCPQISKWLCLPVSSFRYFWTRNSRYLGSITSPSFRTRVEKSNTFPSVYSTKVSLSWSNPLLLYKGLNLVYIMTWSGIKNGVRGGGGYKVFIRCSVDSLSLGPSAEH